MPTSESTVITQSGEMTFLHRVYGWMAAGLAVTAAISYAVVLSPQILNVIIGNPLVFYGLLIAELAAVIFLSGWSQRIDSQTAAAAFLGYAVLNGLTLSVIFIAYTASSIGEAFVVSALMFGVWSMYGITAKKDLTGVGSFAYMALIGLIIASVFNIFFQNEMIYWITSYAGVLIFSALTAYDTQKLKTLYASQDASLEVAKKAAIIGALTLYLDFINMFLSLLRIFGGRR